MRRQPDDGDRTSDEEAEVSETLLDELLERAFLFDEPATYRAGVVDAWTAIREATIDT